jgi:hypothetical protein
VDNMSRSSKATTDDLGLNKDEYGIIQRSCIQMNMNTVGINGHNMNKWRNNWYHM